MFLHKINQIQQINLDYFLAWKIKNELLKSVKFILIV